MATCIHPSQSCLPPFYTIPIFPLLNSTCLLPFFGCTLHLFYTLRNIILPEVICCCLHTCCLYIVLLELCYIYLPISLLLWASYIFKDRLPEAICCCLQTCSVDVVLLVMCCMCIPVFIVTSADKSQLWVYLCYLLIYCLRIVVVVYKLVMFMEHG